MTEYLYPALFAVFIWWFSTGVIIYLNGLPRHTLKWSMTGATVVLAASLFGLYATASDTSISGAYWAFTFGLLAWGWQEASFFMGFVTGPRKEACPETCRGIKHFWHGVEVGLWHELAIIATFAAILALTWGGENQVGFWTFCVLWLMRQSAKLNVFFGVRNLNEEFLPDHLAYIRRYLTKRPMNLLFPVSVTVSTVVCFMLFDRALAADTSPFEAAGLTFLSVLLALAILEHWFLVLPLPFGKLWHWGLKSRGANKAFDLEIAAGFVGSGKTTFLSRRLTAAGPDVRTVALVNDFADFGVDASLLWSEDAEVIELPGGCICCSLKEDLATQVKETVAQYKPDRIMIEPSGVADTASVMSVLNRPEIKLLTKSTRLYAIIDAGTFQNTFARMPDYFRVQASLDPIFVINKIDLVDDATLAVVLDTLAVLNPDAEICASRFGLIDEKRSTEIASMRTSGYEALSVDSAAAPGLRNGGGPGHGRHHNCNSQSHSQFHGDPAVILELQSFSARLTEPCDAQPLSSLLNSIVDGAFGEIDRVKGIARSGNGWLRFDVAGGRPSITALPGDDHEQARLVAIGRTIDGAALEAAFRCLPQQSASAS